MTRRFDFQPQKFRAYSRRDLHRIPQLRKLSRERLVRIQAVSAVLPFRVNNYVLENLIRWEDVPEDPIFQLTFPQEGMLEPHELARLIALVEREAPAAELERTARQIQSRMNPHPSGQRELNVPELDGEVLEGAQHKYRETVLFFPRQGQTCHAYCTYCFRWAQFVGIEELRFANREVELLIDYIRAHPEISDVLFTGGDPLIMKSRVLRGYVEPLLSSDLDQVTTIRIGTKATAYWPYRFLTDPDADDLLELFREVRRSGRHLALMSHYSHPAELETPAARAALERIHETGATVRCQAPIVRHVNDDADVWADLWREEVRLGAVPYYMFVERDTGPRAYFEVPLVKALEIFQRAHRQVSGLARTVRGPSMSATPGKVCIDGVTRIAGRNLLALNFIQARDPSWTGRPFFAEYDPRACWLDELRPAFGEREFFFEKPMRLLYPIDLGSRSSVQEFEGRRRTAGE